MNRLSDAAWHAIVRARGAVQGKALMMSMFTMATIQKQRGQSWHPEVSYRLYDVPVIYDESLRFGEVRLEKW